MGAAATERAPVAGHTRDGRPFRAPAGPILVGTVAVALLCAPAPAPAQTVDLDRVQQLAARGDVQPAREALARWEDRWGADASPEQRARAWYLAGRLAERGSDAELYYIKLVIEGSNSTYADDALLQLGRYHFALGDHARSLDYLARLRRDYPTSELAAEALLWIARGARSRGDSARACAAAEQALREVAPTQLPLMRSLQEIRTACVAGAGIHSVQVAALRDAEAAGRLAQQLRDQGYDAWVKRPEPPDSLSRVRVGRGLGGDRAQEIVERLIAAGYSPFLVTEPGPTGDGG